MRGFGFARRGWREFPQVLSWPQCNIGNRPAGLVCDQTKPVTFGSVIITDENPPVLKWSGLEGETGALPRQVLHPINEPAQAVSAPPVAVHSGFRPRAVRFPIIHVGFDIP